MKELILKLMAMTPAEAEKFFKDVVITQDDGLKGAFTVTGKDKFDSDKIDFVVCGYASPDAYRVQGAIDVECDDCQAMIILSPSSPLKKPKVCFACAQARANEEQSINE